MHHQLQVKRPKQHFERKGCDHKPVGDEVAFREGASRNGLSILRESPMGIGKSRSVASLAWRLGRTSIGVACRDDPTLAVGGARCPVLGAWARAARAGGKGFGAALW